MKFNRFARLDVPKMLERLGIKAREKQSGRKFEACCPHPGHSDKSPSWYIKNIPGEPLHGAHACQGCKFKGGPIALASAVLGVSEEEAKVWLLDLTAPPPMPSRIDLEFKEDVRHIRFTLPECFKVAEFGAWPNVHKSYATQRLSDWQIQRWGIGYVSTCKCRAKRHANRIFIPIYDSKGEVFSYTARSVVGSKLRYVEPESDEHPKRVIFGEQYWADQPCIVVVEGIFDALAVEQVLGTDIAIAALRGSSPRPLELARLSQFPKIVLMMDNDKAGKAARKELHNSRSLHSKIVDVELEPGVDASEMTKEEESRKSLELLLKKAIDSK